MSLVKYYQELTMLPDAEVSENHIWNKVYQQLHIALASQMQNEEKGKIGVSFPQYESGKDMRLGSKLRIFAEAEEELAELDISRCLRVYRDYVHITQIRVVPDRVKGYSTYRRYHQEASSSQKARRYAKRHNISYDEALKLFPQVLPADGLPYVQLYSESTKKKYKLYIEKRDNAEENQTGFGSYGLDNESTVPEF